MVMKAFLYPGFHSRSRDPLPAIQLDGWIRFTLQEFRWKWQIVIQIIH